MVALGVFVAFWRPGAADIWVDEVTYSNAGWEYVHGNTAPNPEHPPLAKLIFGAWQLMFGHGVEPLRVLMGFVLFATALTIWWWASRITGKWWALAPAGMWLLMGRTFENRERLDRLASLDMVMVLFLVLSFALVWRWWETRSPWLALLSGVIFGAATMSKIPAAVFIPAVLVFFIGPGRERRVIRSAGLFVAGLVAVCIAVLAPFGGFDAIVRMVDFQGAHDAQGHAILIDGSVFQFAPWWVTFWFAADGLGIAGSIALVLGTAAAIAFLRPRRFVALLMTGLASALLFFAVISRVALPHYYLDWIWIPTILTGATLPVLFQRKWRAFVAFAIAIGATVSIAGNLYQVATIRPTGIAVAAKTLDMRGTTAGPVLVQGISPSLSIASYVEHPVGAASWPGITAVILGDDPRQPLNPAVSRFAAQPPTGVTVTRIDNVRLFTFSGVLELRDGVLRLNKAN
jgi:4-amino-4-deoxy-L-arabinose transferase-like glycosyltransferase